MFKPERFVFVAILSVTTLSSVRAISCFTEGAGTGIGVPIKEGIPTKGTGQIELESIRIEIQLGAAPRTDTTYVVYNHGGATTMTISFPATRAELTSEEMYGEVGKHLHKVTVDGEELEGRVAEHEGQRCDQPLEMVSVVGEPAPCYYLVDVPFKAGQRRTIHHIFNSARVKYEMEGASLRVPIDGLKSWRRTGPLVVQVEFEEPMSYCLAVNMKGAKYDANTRRLTWSCTHCASNSEFRIWWVPAVFIELDILRPASGRIYIDFPDTDFRTISKVVSDAPLDSLVNTYRDLLASRRAGPPADPFDEQTFCVYDSYPVNQPHIWLGLGTDSGVDLSAWSQEGRNVLRAIDAELKRRGIAHTNLPVWKRRWIDPWLL